MRPKRHTKTFRSLKKPGSPKKRDPFGSSVIPADLWDIPEGGAVAELQDDLQVLGLALPRPLHFIHL